MSISADKTIIASGSSDKTIRLWNVKTGDCHIIGQHKTWINTVTFYPTDSQLLMSSSNDSIVQQWGVDGQQIGPPISGCFHVAFSPDGTQFVSHEGEVVTIRNTGSRAAVVEFNMGGYVGCCCFSPDGRFIAASAHSIIYLLNIAGPDPCLVQTLIGHTDYITSLVFPSSLTLISASADKSIKFWQIGASSADLAAPGTGPTPLTSVPISSVSLQVKDCLAFSIDSEGVVKTWNILTGHCKESYNTPAKYIRCGDIQFIDDSGHCKESCKTQTKGIGYGDMQLIDGRLVVVWCELSRQGIHVWDAERGRFQTVNLPYLFTNGLRIIGDGSRVVWVGQDSIQAWYIQTGESAGEERLGESYEYCFNPLQMDGSKVWVQSKESSAQGWDFGVTGLTPIQLFETPSDRPLLDLVDVRRWSKTIPVKIKDSITGRDVFQLYGKYADPSAIQWDGQYLIAGYQSGEVLILDLAMYLLS